MKRPSWDDKTRRWVDDAAMSSIESISVKTNDGKDSNLGAYSGKVRLVVNVASKCGLTPQYEALEAIYKKYQDKGFVILGFPANDFNHQEPGSDAEIAAFCKDKFDVTFDMFSKVVVKGADKSPLFKFLTAEQRGLLGLIDGRFERQFVVQASNGDVWGAGVVRLTREET